MAKLFSKTKEAEKKQAEKPAKKAETPEVKKTAVKETVKEEHRAIPVAPVPANSPAQPGKTLTTMPNNWFQKTLRLKAAYPQLGDINLSGSMEENLTRLQVKLGKTRAEIERIILSL